MEGGDDGEGLGVSLKTLFTGERVNVISLAVGVLGIGLAIWMYIASIERPEPTFLVDPNRTRIIDTREATGKDSDFEVLFRGQKIPATNVTAVHVYLWNAGRAPIRAADVRWPFQVRVQTVGQVLEARLIRVSRTVVHFTVDSSDIDQPLVNLMFDVLVY
jgi:hypothetical protein